MKTCNYCQKELSYENFTINKANKDGFSNRCKECYSKTRKRPEKKNRIQYDTNRSEKECNICKQTLDIELFGKSSNIADGRENTCKSCRSERRRKNAEQKRKLNIKIFKKHCSHCKKTLDIENFSLDRSRDDGYSAICKSCKSETYKEYIRNSPDAQERARERTRIWKENNPDAVKEYYRKNRRAIIARSSNYHKFGFGKFTLFNKHRGIDNTLTQEEYESLINSPCHYCGDTNLPNGVDRLDSSLGYVIENCAPCCSTCNYGKNILSESEFINHAAKIVKFQNDQIPEGRAPVVKYSGNIKNDHYLSPFGQFCRYRSSAKERKISFNLEYEDFITFWQSPCSYCGSTIDLIGLDRIDNNKGYQIGNITPCCTNCNNLKRTMSKEEFLIHAQKIYSHFKGK